MSGLLIGCAAHPALAVRAAESAPDAAIEPARDAWLGEVFSVRGMAWNLAGMGLGLALVQRVR